MAKQKKKSNKRTKPYPPLSKLDKTIYSVCQIIIIVLLYTLILGYEWFAPYFVFKNNVNALGFFITDSFYRIIPFLIVMFAVCITIIEKLTTKKPLFGNKKIDYYNTTFYRFILPPLDKRYIKRVFTKEKIKKTIIKLTLLTLIIFITGIYGWSGIVSRWEITESEITKYGAFGKTETVYNYDDIESYTVEVFMEKVFYKTLILVPELGIDIKLKNQETINMDLDFINNGLSGFFKLNKALDGIDKIVDNHRLEEYIEQHNVSDEDVKILYEIYR